MRFIVEERDVSRFKYCPYCGSNFMSVYVGDYGGVVECYDCESDDEMGFTILEEFRDRFPDKFKKEMGL